MSDLEKIEKLQNLLRTDRSNFQARRQLAMLLLDNGYKEEALAHFLHLAEIFKEDSELYYNIGIVYEKLRDLDNAEKAYSNAVKFAPDDVDAYYNLQIRDNMIRRLNVLKLFLILIMMIQILILI